MSQSFVAAAADAAPAAADAANAAAARLLPFLGFASLDALERDHLSNSQKIESCELRDLNPVSHRIQIL